jgi:hypothetical protein
MTSYSAAMIDSIVATSAGRAASADVGWGTEAAPAAGAGSTVGVGAGAHAA